MDTSVVYALMDAGDSGHASAVAWYSEIDDELVTTPLVLAEVDHLLGRVGGREGLRAFRADLAAGAYVVDWWPEAVEESLEVALRYESLGIDLTDASLVALAGRLATTRIATADERHFRSVRPLTGEPAFTLLPADV